MTTALDARRYFLRGMRIFFGAWLLYVGLVKWVMFGAPGFVGFICADFDKTWSPHWLNAGLGWLIVVAEPAFGAWILSGWRERCAWASTSALMFLLAIGQTILMKPEVGDNWHYVVLTLACAALSDPEKPAAVAV